MKKLNFCKFCGEKILEESKFKKNWKKNKCPFCLKLLYKIKKKNTISEGLIE